MACVAQNGTLATCVSSDAACSGCPAFAEENAMEGFFKAIDGAFKKTQAFVMTTDPAFCTVAQDSVDQETQANYNCCCSTEIQDYIKCTFDQELSVSFGLVGCEYTDAAGDDAEGGSGDEGGFPLMMIIIIAVAAVVLCCCCCGGFYCYRRRQRNNKVEVKVDINSISNTNSTNKDERCGNSNVTTATKNTTSDWSTADDAMDMAERGAPPPPPPPPHNRAIFGYNDDDDQTDYIFRKHAKMQRSSSKRLEYDDEDESRTRRSSRSRSRSRPNSRSKTRSKSRKMKQTSSKRRLRDSHDYDDDDESTLSGPSSSDEESDSSRKRSSKVKNRKKDKTREGMKQSMRQARSLIKGSRHLDDFDETAQANMNNEMAQLVTELKQQKDEMETKLKAVEDEKSQLKLTMESNLREADKKVASAELDIVKREKEEMARMIEKLELAKTEMEDNFRRAKEEAKILKEQQQETVTQVEEMIFERERLCDKLSTVELSRDDIHKRLMEAEIISQQLKEEKKSKTKEIHALRTTGATPLVEASEHDRRTICKSLKRVEEEKAFFRSMMAQMVRDETGSVRGLDNPQQPFSANSLTPSQCSNNSNLLMSYDQHIVDAASARPSFGRSNSSALLMEKLSSHSIDTSSRRPGVVRSRSSNSSNFLMEHMPAHPMDMSARRPGVDPSRSSTRLMDYGKEAAMDQLEHHKYGKNAHPGSGDLMMTESSASPMIYNTHSMLRNLEQDMMSVQVSHLPKDDVSLISNPLESVERPAGWLGEVIRNRSFTNLTQMDTSYRSHRTRSSKTSRKSRSRSRSNSKSSRRHRSNSGDRTRSRSRDCSDHSRLKEKREKVRHNEQKYDEMKQSRSSRSSRNRKGGIDCDASSGSLNAEEFF